MTAEAVIKILEALARMPAIADAMLKLVQGHPDTRTVREILEARSRSREALEDLRR